MATAASRKGVPRRFRAGKSFYATAVDLSERAELVAALKRAAEGP